MRNPALSDWTSYQRGMVDAIVDERRYVRFYAGSQTGKSNIDRLRARLCDGLRSGPILHVSPTDGKATDFVASPGPLIKASPALRSIIGGGRKGGGDSLSHKMLPWRFAEPRFVIQAGRPRRPRDPLAFSSTKLIASPIRQDRR